MTRPRTFAEGAILRPGAVRSLAALLSRLSPAGRSALVFLTLLALLGLAAPLMPLADPASVNLAQKLAGPGPEHWLGTDSLGRDLMSRVIWGVRSSLLTALAATAATALFGALYGGIAAAFGSRVDSIMMRLCDFWMSFPSEVMILAVVGLLGPGLENVVIACLAAKWPWYARMVRTLARRMLDAGFVVFARVSGARPRDILLRHILPNASAEFCVLATVDSASVLLMISALSFLGLGVSAPNPEWGMMLAEARNVMTLYPWQMLPPGLALLGAAAALHFLGDALAEVLDPKNALRARDPGAVREAP